MTDETERKERKIGKFYIPNYVLETDRELVRQVLSGIIVVRAEQRYDYDAIEYIGFADCFVDVPEGQLPPEWEARFEVNEEGSARFAGWHLKDSQ